MLLSAVSIFRRELISKHSTLSDKYLLDCGTSYLWAYRHPAEVLTTETKALVQPCTWPSPSLLRRQHGCTVRLTPEGTICIFQSQTETAKGHSCSIESEVKGISRHLTTHFKNLSGICLPESTQVDNIHVLMTSLPTLPIFPDIGRRRVVRLFTCPKT